jgi:hypothetical protein
MGKLSKVHECLRTANRVNAKKVSNRHICQSGGPRAGDLDEGMFFSNRTLKRVHASLGRLSSRSARAQVPVRHDAAVNYCDNYALLGKRHASAALIPACRPIAHALMQMLTFGRRRQAGGAGPSDCLEQHPGQKHRSVPLYSRCDERPAQQQRLGRDATPAGVSSPGCRDHEP